MKSPTTDVGRQTAFTRQLIGHILRENLLFGVEIRSAVESSTVLMSSHLTDPFLVDRMGHIDQQRDKDQKVNHSFGTLRITDASREVRPLFRQRITNENQPVEGQHNDCPTSEQNDRVIRIFVEFTNDRRTEIHQIDREDVKRQIIERLKTFVEQRQEIEDGQGSKILNEGMLGQCKTTDHQETDGVTNQTDETKEQCA